MREPPSRDDNETTTARCPICNSGFTPIRRLASLPDSGYRTQ